MSTFVDILPAMPFPARIDPRTLGARALQVVEEKGFDRWSLRDVARSLEVSPNALYRHVGSRDGLLIAVAAQAVEALAAALTERGLPPAGEDRVVAVARRYVRFAVRRPHAYAAFVHAKPDIDDPRVGPWLMLWTRVREEVEPMVPQAADAAGFALWAFLHGRVQLALGPARMAAPDAGLDDAVRALLDGFKAQSPLDSPLPPPIRR